MGKTTLTVPAKYAEAFRDAVLVEIRSDGRRLADSVDEIQRRRFTYRAEAEEARRRELPAPEYVVDDLGDVQSSTRSVHEDLALCEQAFAAPDDAMEITGDLEAIAYALETMADKVFGPMLASELNTSPVGDNVEAITHLTGAIDWAVSESARLNDIWKVEWTSRNKAEVA